MKYAHLGLILIVATIAMYGCGGGGGVSTPDNGGSTGNQKTLQPVAPGNVVGGHTVSIIPDQVNIVTGATPQQLQSIVGAYGFSVLSQSGSRATIQLSGGVSPSDAAKLLEKEYSIVSAEPVHRILCPRFDYASSNVARQASFTPGDPFFGEQFIGFGSFGTPPAWGYAQFIGQAFAMNVMGFNGAWDVALSDPAGEDVRITIIDAGWFDYSTAGTRAGFNDGLLDDDNSGFLASDGTLTPGLAAATWDVHDVGNGTPPVYSRVPYRDTGELMLGVLAADLNTYTPRAYDFNGTADIQEDEVWNEGIAGINPNATLIIIKTGAVSGTPPDDVWSFSDNDIAEAIKYAAADSADLNGGKWPNGGADADIILLGMFAQGAVAANIQTQVNTARSNDVLVIAPAGDVMDSFDGSVDPPVFTDTPVDITVTPVTPASATGIVSVSAAGCNHVGTLPDVTITNPPPDHDVPNIGRGWTPGLAEPLNDPYYDLARYSNTGAMIAGVGYGIGFDTRPFFIGGGDGSQGDPYIMIPGENYTLTLTNFGTVWSAAYVAGAASQVFQTLSFVNSAAPTDDEVLSELTSTVQFAGMTGLVPGGGLLNAGAAMTSAINGGHLNTILPALGLAAQVSQPFAAVTRGTDFVVTPTAINGTAPFTLIVDWDNGTTPVTIDPWTSGDAVTLTGGYSTLGLKGLNLTLTDDDNQSVNLAFAIHVIDPLTASISITDAAGAAAAVGNLIAQTPYRFTANLANVYTGTLGDPPVANTMTISWDFNGDSTVDASGANPSYTYAQVPSNTNYTVTLTINETVRPDTVVTADVTVKPST